MRNLTYEGITYLNKENIGQVPRLYAKVFAGEPWREVSRCSLCGGFSGSNPAEFAACSNPKCSGTYSLEAYPEGETRDYIKDELSKPNAAGFQEVRESERGNRPIEEVYGFAWGYESAARLLAEAKYSGEEMQQILTDLLVKAGPFFYVSEVGVDPDLQLKGKGKGLTKRLATAGESLGFKTLVLRTNEDSPMRYISEKLGMKPIIGLDTGIKDKENEARVIFVGGRYARD